MYRFQHRLDPAENAGRVLFKKLAPLVFNICAIAFITGFFPSFAVAAAPGTLAAESVITAGTPAAITFMISVLILKVTAFVLGYLIVRLGHDTMVKGVSGAIDFGFSGSGFKTKLKSATPGAFFVLMGAAIILWGLTVEKPMEIKTLHAPQQTIEPSAQQESGALHRVKVPD